MAEIVKKERVPYRIWDKVNSKWNELMLKTNAKSVDADDGKTLETKIGAINGITSDLNGESEDVAASIKCVNQLNNSLNGLSFAQDEDGNWGYKVGADTVTPFRGKITQTVIKSYDLYNGTGIGNVDCTSIPNYKNLTIDNFIIRFDSAWRGMASQSTDQTVYYNIIGYNASTGILSTSVSGSGHIRARVSIICIH